MRNKKLQLSLIWMLPILFFALISCGNGAGNGRNPAHPNIVLIMADDLGYGDAGCYNPESKINTPNIDQLAADGMLFTDAHTPASICTPSRYGLLTGRYAWRTRLKSGVILGYDEAPLIPEDRATLASLLGHVGYRSACIGKWHLGMNWQTKDGYQIQDDQNNWSDYSGVFKENEEHIDFNKPTSGGPIDLGFEYFFGTLGCSTSDNPYCFIENDRTVGTPSVLISEKWRGLPGVVTALMEPNWSMEAVDQIFTEKAINFIDQHQESHAEKPFFLYLALSSPHIPFLPPDFTAGQSAEGPRGDLILVVDWSLGQINKSLEQHGITDNTLIIFTSDNGPRRGANGHQSAGSYRGYKGTIWEGGHRVPFIAKWPGKIQAGSTSHKTISLTDLMATFGSLTGQSLNQQEGEDSYNMYPAFFGEEITGAQEQARIFHSAPGVFAIRQGKWKLIEGTKGSGQGRLNLTKDSLEQVGQLYDLENDPYETVDLFEMEQEVVKELQKLMNEIKTKKLDTDG